MTNEPADPMPTAAALPPHPGAPRWGKVMGIVVLLLAVILLGAKVAGGGGGIGDHGPGRHSAPMGVTVEQVSQPAVT